MPLKPTLANKIEVDALDAALRPLYVEREGKFVLDVEGLVPAADVHDLKLKIVEFRDNNTNLLREVGELRPLKTKYEGIDPDEARTIKVEYEKLKTKGITKSDDLQAAINAAVTAATKPINDKLAEESAAREKAQRLADDARFRELVSVDASKVGVKANSMRHVLREAGEKFEFKDGVIVPKAGVKHPTDPLKTLSTSEWLTDLAKTDDYLFEPSVGGGAGNGGSGGGGTGGAKKLINPSPEEMGRHMDEIASGKMVVVRQ